MQLCRLLDALSARTFPLTPLLHFYVVLHAGGKSRAFCLRVLRFPCGLFTFGECTRPRVVHATGPSFGDAFSAITRGIARQRLGVRCARVGATTWESLPSTHGGCSWWCADDRGLCSRSIRGHHTSMETVRRSSLWRHRCRPHDDWSCGCGDEDGLDQPWFISFSSATYDSFFVDFVYGGSALVSARSKDL